MTKGHLIIAWEVGNILHYDYGGSYTNLYLCQHYLKFTLKITGSLYVNYASIYVNKKSKKIIQNTNEENMSKYKYIYWVENYMLVNGKTKKWQNLL